MHIVDLTVIGQEDPSLVQQLVTEISRLTKEVLLSLDTPAPIIST